MGPKAKVGFAAAVLGMPRTASALSLMGTAWGDAGFTGTGNPFRLPLPHIRVPVLFSGSRHLQECRGLMNIRYPIEHGVVTNWNDMERLWSYVYSKEQLGVPPEEHPVLLTEAPLNPRRNREKAAEVFFEAFGTPALFFSMQAVLSLYASGRTTGVVIDSGDGVTHAVPVYEGFAMKHSIQRIDVAGRDITRYLKLLLRREGLNFKTSAEFEIVRTIKEQACYVTANPAKEEQLEMDRSSDKGHYVLPDGQQVSVSRPRTHRGLRLWLRATTACGVACFRDCAIGCRRLSPAHRRPLGDVRSARRDSGHRRCCSTRA